MTVFASREFNHFLKRWSVSAAPSTPHCNQSNGHAEAAVNAMKTLIATTTMKADLNDENLQRRLLEGISPAQIILGRPLRSAVPAHRLQASGKKMVDEQETNCRQALARNEERYNRQFRPLPQQRIGIQVRLQNPSGR